MGECIVELAYARDRVAEPTAEVGDTHRATLWVVPGPTDASPPPLPRRPSRRAVVRAQVWGVPVSRRGCEADRVDERDVDSRIAEAVRLLAGL
jgi:hypothetical protein